MTTKMTDHPIHLGLGATAVVEPPFDGVKWYAGYSERHGGDGAEGRLVTMYTFTTSWDVWEMHPAGSEVVLCTAGAITLVQEALDGAVVEVALGPGEYAINEPGVWHTADVAESATAVFITAGMGTEHRKR
jgi:quercetin dioxygenase-like cupin family protein